MYKVEYVYEVEYVYKVESLYTVEYVYKVQKCIKWNTCHIGFKLLCKMCRHLPLPAMDARFTVFGKDGHADPSDGWRCSLLKRVMSRQIQVRQQHTNKSGFAISAINKYIVGSRSIRYTRTEHWVQLISATIRPAQYT